MSTVESVLKCKDCNNFESYTKDPLVQWHDFGFCSVAQSSKNQNDHCCFATQAMMYTAADTGKQRGEKEGEK